MFGAYTAPFGLTTGTFFTVQTGTPLSRHQTIDFAFRSVFGSQRGSEGRTPTIWDLNLRFQYPIPISRSRGVQADLIADFLHIGNPQTVTFIDQFETTLGGIPNATFGEPFRFQEPFTVRLGLAVGF